MSQRSSYDLMFSPEILEICWNNKKIHWNSPTANRISREVKVTSVFNLVFTFGPGKPTPSDPVSPGRPAGPGSPFGMKWKKWHNVGFKVIKEARINVGWYSLEGRGNRHLLVQVTQQDLVTLCPPTEPKHVTSVCFLRVHQWRGNLCWTHLRSAQTQPRLSHGSRRTP